MKKDIVIGLGEIGMPIYKKLSKFLPVEGLDKNKKAAITYPKITLFLKRGAM